jgi:hypothetical protein
MCLNDVIIDCNPRGHNKNLRYLNDDVIIDSNPRGHNTNLRYLNDDVIIDCNPRGHNKNLRYLNDDVIIRGVAAYTLSRHGVHIERLKMNEKKCIVTISSLIKSV